MGKTKEKTLTGYIRSMANETITITEDAVIERIKHWDKRDANELAELISMLSSDARELVDMSDLPSAEIPDDVDTAYPVWAIDESGMMLVGDDAAQIMSLDDYRKQ